ncbi:terpenoid cyclases/protein prenyltransferase alpha-alpha toroid [Fusarium redolens]|uniref:Protein farnesyltransferase subunit beta n=1 Tax=Fusarium redolens TaxID=48865 RepID=A0A9P9HYU6_FUSRE|nr:terpenoid cyclases/protein prenyltransferase alpha-alpha toroid [Fusarium redolens]KAH7265372.1 terpenoid cyclases/protein prenyltransferase alpha-alpha toroid [Fusarium redolens]
MASAATAPQPDAELSIPPLFTTEPLIRDSLPTESSRVQDATIDEVLPFLQGEEFDYCNSHGLPHLDRRLHVKFLHKQLGKLPAAFTAADPSRPWFFYWCLSALVLLGEDVTEYRQRLVDTVRPMQNQDGGFAGGFGHTSHLATSYATVLSLALVGGEDAYEVIDRRAMWRWLCSLKQPDGGFQMALGGEEDVRTLLHDLLATLVYSLGLQTMYTDVSDARNPKAMLPSLIVHRKGQTHEGGVSAKPGIEAHGAYAFCALGCLSILDSPHRSIPRHLNVPLLISWLSSRQYAPEGGFSGRTNKLVDGCYSHWVGGCWPLIEAALNGPGSGPGGEEASSGGHALPAAKHSLFSRDGLIRYILCCCQDQSKRGGLRDKPSKFSDAYHTCYVLSGLSAAQHKWNLDVARPHEADVTGDSWSVTPYMEGEQIFDEEDRVATVHPVYVIPQHTVEDMQSYFSSKHGF